MTRILSPLGTLAATLVFALGTVEAIRRDAARGREAERARLGRRWGESVRR